MKTQLLNQNGGSLIEVLMGAVISTIVMVGAMAVMTDVFTMNSRNQLESLVNQTYFQGLQVAQNARLFSERNPAAVAALQITTDLKKCLAHNPQYNAGSNLTFDCRTLDNTVSNPTGLVVADTIDDSLNLSFTPNGRCSVGETEATCMVRRTTTYNWVCPAREYCSGLLLTIVAKPLGDKTSGGQDARSPSSYKERRGSVFIPGRQMMSKGEISFTCGSGSTPNYALYGLDFLQMTDRNGCSTFDPGATCSLPMRLYGAAAANCSTTQNSGCEDGYRQAGLFDVQAQGINGCTP